MFFDIETQLAWPTEVIPNFLYLGSLYTLTKDEYNQQFDVVISVMKNAPRLPITQHIIEINDSESEKITPHFETIVEILKAAQLNEHKVLIHCEKGMSRSASFVLYWLLREQSHNGELVDYNTTLKSLVKMRGVVAPNPGFTRELQAYAESLNASLTIDSNLLPMRIA